MSVAQMPAGLGNTVRALLSISALAVVLHTGGAGAVPPSTPKAAPKTLQPEIIERVDPGRVDPGRVDRGRVDEGGVDPGRVDRGRVDRGGVDPGRVDEGGVDQGRVDEGGVDPGGVDEGRVDEGGVDEGRVDPGGVDEGRVDEGRVDPGGVDEGRVDEGGVDPGRGDEGGVEQGRVEQGRVEQGRVDEGRVDPGGVDPGRVDEGPAFVERVDKGPAHVIEALKCLQAAPSKEATRECNVAWMAAQQDQVVSIQASPDDRLLAALHFGGRISLYDVTTQKKIAENKIEGLAIRHQHLSFSPDGRFLGIGMPQAKERADGRVVVAAGQGVTSIVDLKTGKTCEHRGRDGPTTLWENGALMIIGANASDAIIGTTTIDRNCRVIGQAKTLSEPLKTRLAKRGSRLTTEPKRPHQWAFAWNASQSQSASIGPLADGVALKCGTRTHRLKTRTSILAMANRASWAAVGQGNAVLIFPCD